jgi:nucleotide-binding universal stress UspA family protein
MRRKIIIGYDPAHGGEDALRLGRLVSEALEAQPIVATTVPWPGYLMQVTGLQERLESGMEERLGPVREELADLDAETRAIAAPSVPAGLHELAEAEHADAIVIGSSHHGPLGRTLAGSVGVSLMHGAPCAIAVAPRGFGDRPAVLSKLAVAFDGSPEAWAALETGIGIAERCDAQPTVIAVADHPHYGYVTTWSILAAGELRNLEQEEKSRLEELAVGRIPARLDGGGRVLTGDAGTVLSDASGEFDLMVTGSRGYGPLRRTLLGSTTRRLLASSECPVLVLPRGAGMDPLGLRSSGRPAQVTAPPAG